MPARKAIPKAWKIRNVGNTSREGDSRIQTLKSVCSSQAVKCTPAVYIESSFSDGLLLVAIRDG
jgi:hypothetical protein